MRKKIGECLIQAGLITEDDLSIALAEHKRTGERLGVVLVRMNLATEKQIAKALAFQLGFPYINLAENPPDPDRRRPDSEGSRAQARLRRRRPRKEPADGGDVRSAAVQPRAGSRVPDRLSHQAGRRDARRHHRRDSDRLSRQGADAHDAESRSELARAASATRSRAAARRASRCPRGETALARRVEEEVFEPVAGLKERSEAAPIIDLVDLVVKSAIKSKASDIHVEPMEKGVLIRHRLDGLLKEVMDLPKWVHEGLIARLKIMAGMDIAEKRLPQDGRLRSTAEDGTEVDFRVSTLRTLFGEKVVMRVLDHRKGVPALEEIGMSAAALEEVREFLRHQHGMILVVGPTGSGKTTTLSSALKAVQSEKTNIITIEDPVEYQIPGVNQTQINEKIKLTFASALRSILRQDPDVILLGEIRDAETAKIAMQAAQTGHLVLSTLHTDNAPSVVTRLMDIGAEPYVIASALVGVVAQRLVRRLCVHCRRQYTPPADVLRALNIAEADAAAIPFYKSVGCDQCNHTGYRGRIGIYEVMRVTDKLRRLICGASRPRISFARRRSPAA